MSTQELFFLEVNWLELNIFVSKWLKSWIILKLFRRQNRKMWLTTDKDFIQFLK